MPPWSRSNPAVSATATSATHNSTADASAAPPPFLANHHRSSSMASSTGSIPTLSKTSGRFGSKGKAREEEQTVADDDPWNEGSDDEATVAALAGNGAHGLNKLSISSPTTSASHQSSSTADTPTRATSPASPAAPSPSSWSFNPFSIISSGSKPRPPSRQTSLSGAEAVAAALAGQLPPATNAASAPSTAAPATTSTPSKSYLASASEIQAEADELVEEEERAKGKSRDELGSEEPAAAAENSPEVSARPSIDGSESQAASKHRRTGSKVQVDEWKAAIKPNVEELVKDPVSLLGRLTVAPPPLSAPPTVQPSPIVDTFSHRASISAINADSEDDDPAAGYVQLDATNLSSGGPQVVDYSKEEDPEETAERGREKRRRKKFFDCLGSPNVDLSELRSLAWSGVPSDLRPIAWQLLLGYLPAPSTRRLATLARKRQEYADAVRLAFSRGVKGLDGPIWHQISIDVPRTNSSVRLWQGEGTQRSLERILYVWAIRHPASGYVQGINDLVTPFFQVFLSSYIDSDPESYDVSALPPSVLEALEADSFWCLSKLLDGIQDNYIFAQPGITRQVARMKELCARVDAPLAAHLEENGVEFIQFAFRWINCLLMREMSVTNIIRMWDTYLAEGGDAFSEFHLYVCLAFLVKWSDQLREMDFQNIIIFLQSLPTKTWTDKNIELLLSEAFMWSRTFVAR